MMCIPTSAISLPVDVIASGIGQQNDFEFPGAVCVVYHTCFAPNRHTEAHKGRDRGKQGDL
jgi:hypothetical protein